MSDFISITGNVQAIADYVDELYGKLQMAVPRAIDTVVREGYDIALQAHGDELFELDAQPSIGDWYFQTTDDKQVYFTEFGTGTKVKNKNPFAKDADCEIEPGSYSMTQGKHTWQHWINSGAKGKYPYDNVPNPGMAKAYRHIKKNAKKAAVEALNK